MSENSIDSILSMISSNPELISKISSAVQGGDDLSKSLSSVISLISENQENKESVNALKENTEKRDTPTGNFKKEEVSPSNDKVDSLISSLSKSISKNSSLLIALKPYLNKNRCDIIDTVVKVSKLANVMNLAK